MLEIKLFWRAGRCWGGDLLDNTVDSALRRNGLVKPSSGNPG